MAALSSSEKTSREVALLEGFGKVGIDRCIHDVLC
jgi:hypothetical protein